MIYNLLLLFTSFLYRPSFALYKYLLLIILFFIGVFISYEFGSIYKTMCIFEYSILHPSGRNPNLTK